MEAKRGVMPARGDGIEELSPGKFRIRPSIRWHGQLIRQQFTVGGVTRSLAVRLKEFVRTELRREQADAKPSRQILSHLADDTLQLKLPDWVKSALRKGAARKSRSLNEFVARILADVAMQVEAEHDVVPHPVQTRRCKECLKTIDPALTGGWKHRHKGRPQPRFWPRKNQFSR
jgi:predicted HicB family RNase H-like nuclease